jgi:hypothetical protein
MAASDPERGVDVVEVQPPGGPDESPDLIAPGRRVPRWLLAGAVLLLVGGGAAGWLARGAPGRPDGAPSWSTAAPEVGGSAPARVAAVPPPAGCPDAARVRPIRPSGAEPLVAALRQWFPAYAVVGGRLGVVGPIRPSGGHVCGAWVTVRAPDGVAVDLTVVSPADPPLSGARLGPSQVIRLEDAGPDVRAELVRVTPRGTTIDVLVSGPTGRRSPTRQMKALANDPRADVG